MKKLIISLLFASTMTSSFAYEEVNDLTIYAATTTTAVYSPVAGALATSSMVSLLAIAEGFKYYEGLENDAVDVLAGSMEVKESMALSMFKEDMLANKKAIEAEFQVNDIDLTVEELTDEEIAHLALATSIQ